MSMRRGLYVANRTFLSHNLTKSVAPLGGLRFYRTATNTGTSQPQQNGSQFQETTIDQQSAPRGQGFAAMDAEKRREVASKGGQGHTAATTSIDRTETERGDLVGYSVGAHKTEGLVLDIFDKPFTDEFKTHHNASTSHPIVKIQNYFTKQFSYHRLDTLQWIARKQEFESTAGQPKAAPSQAQAAQAKPAQVDEAQSAEYKQQQRLARSAEKVDHEVNAEMSPIHADFAPGDIVRYRHGRNFTAGVVLDIVFKPVHDEAGNFHGASKENPMARLENLWTKKITYHHLSVLEHVKRARDAEKEHGRFADAEFGVYHNNTAKGTSRS